MLQGLKKRNERMTTEAVYMRNIVDDKQGQRWRQRRKIITEDMRNNKDISDEDTGRWRRWRRIYGTATEEMWDNRDGIFGKIAMA